MTIAQTCKQMIPKPWGSTDLRPWDAYHGDGVAIGEIWFQRIGANASDSTLDLKLLFTKEPLSIQVHPDDAFAHSIGLTRGKSEAWYVLSALPDAKIAVGLKRRLTAAQLRRSVDEGSISELIQWRTARISEVIFVPPGTIHSIGPGLVIVEIQQRSAATFRLFDYARQRPLHVDYAVAAASAEQTEHQAPLRTLTTARTLLVASPHFVLERFELPRGSSWELLAVGETWLFILDGCARIGSIEASIGEVLFLEADRMRIEVGTAGLRGLAAYAGSDPNPDLLHRLDGEETGLPGGDQDRIHLRPTTAPSFATEEARA